MNIQEVTKDINDLLEKYDETIKVMLSTLYDLILEEVDCQDEIVAQTLPYIQNGEIYIDFEELYMGGKLVTQKMSVEDFVKFYGKRIKKQHSNN
ncbi:hypothetical protein [Halalkalibacter oceani]|uniref:hypothetical protein n=1 Tax=Halalkalibacter oceani TaxID=1653776 RepID=UPI003396E5E2